MKIREEDRIVVSLFEDFELLGLRGPFVQSVRIRDVDQAVVPGMEDQGGAIEPGQFLLVVQVRAGFFFY